MNKYPVAREQALTTNKYEASLSMARSMSLAVNQTVSLEWVAQEFKSCESFSIVVFVPSGCSVASSRWR